MKIRKLTPCEFARALKLGHGRSFLHVVEFGDEGIDKEIEDALLHCYAYDRQIEGTRSNWTFNLAAATGRLRYYEERTRENLNEGEFTANDLAVQIQIIWQFFESGFPALRKEVFSKHQQLTEIAPYLTDRGTYVIDLAGQFGLDCVARTIGQASSNIDDFDCAYIYDHAKDVLDETKIVEHLQSLSSHDEAIARFLEACARHKAAMDAKPEPRPPQPPLDEILQKVERKEHAPTGLGYSRYGRKFSNEEVQKVFELLEETTDPWKQLAYLRMFAHRPLPDITTRILNLLDATDDFIARVAAKVLSQSQSHLVREAALRLLSSEDENKIAAGFDLIEKNYQPGDEDLIRLALANLSNDDRKHDAGISIQALAETHKTDEMLEFLLWTYENGPDSYCRHKVLEELLRRKQCPPDLLYEAQWDCFEDTQYLARAVVTGEEFNSL